MKRTLFIIAALLTLASASAQTKRFQKFYDTYNGKKGYTTIEMSGKMLNEINTGGESVDKELGDAFKKVKKLYIVVVDNNNDEFTAAIHDIVNSDDYELLTSINDSGAQIKFYIADNQREFLMYVADEDNSLILSVNGEKLTIGQATQFSKIIKVE